jgi:hypothetical protein
MSKNNLVLKLVFQPKDLLKKEPDIFKCEIPSEDIEPSMEEISKAIKKEINNLKESHTYVGILDEKNSDIETVSLQ